MNDRDVAAILAILRTAYPNQQITDQMVALWMDMLADLHPDDAMHAARTLIKREHWFPSIAQFRNEAEANAHGRRNRWAATHGLASGHQAVAPPPRIIENLRAVLTDSGTKKHWHGGPEPCPKCGGMKDQEQP